jgi:hypothetical protein
MKDNQVIYKEEKSRLSSALWVLAIIAVAAVVFLYLYGKTIHDGLSV